MTTPFFERFLAYHTSASGQNQLILGAHERLSYYIKKVSCIHELESMSDRGILSGLGELLDVQAKRWVKEKLRTETIFLLNMKLYNYPA